MKILVFVGSARTAHTHSAAETFLRNMESRGDVEGEIVRLADYELGTCRGCKACMDRGEEFCPLGGDRDTLVSMIMRADAVVFATPNYAFQVSSLMKQFIERMAFMFHRPRMFGKTFTAITAQGIYGGGRILSYLKLVGKAMGFNTVRGSCITTLEPLSDRIRIRNEKILARHARRFSRRLGRAPLPKPSLLELMMFRISRTRIRRMLSEEFRDYSYYNEAGWFESDFYYPIHLGFLKRLLGRMIDGLAGGRPAAGANT